MAVACRHSLHHLRLSYLCASGRQCNRSYQNVTHTHRYPINKTNGTASKHPIRIGNCNNFLFPLLLSLSISSIFYIYFYFCLRVQYNWYFYLYTFILFYFVYRLLLLLDTYQCVRIYECDCGMCVTCVCVMWWPMAVGSQVSFCICVIYRNFIRFAVTISVNTVQYIHIVFIYYC